MIRLLKRLLPTSLFARFLLIILIPTVLVQVIATYMFYERHWSNVSAHMSRSLAGEVAVIVYSRQLPEESRALILHIAKRHLYLRTSFTSKEELGDIRPTSAPELITLKDELAIRLPFPFTVGYVKDQSEIVVAVQMPQGVLRVMASRKRLVNPTTYIFISWMIGTAVVLSIVSILFLKNQVRSIHKLAVAAEKFGKGQDVLDFRPAGAAEIRRAGRAFLHMKSRIARQIARRTEMLAAVSHDLRTPLTRMKLQMALTPASEDIQALQGDVHEMERMIQGYLDFARGEGEEVSMPIVLEATLSSVVEGYRYHPGVEILLHPCPDCTITVRPHGIRRALTNLINNAIRYATKVEISVEMNKEQVRIYIDDNGPGIPEEAREEVFKPFFRLDHSRNLETGGVGLGLAITRDIMLSHGGEITLGDSPLGGLRVMLLLWL